MNWTQILPASGRLTRLRTAATLDGYDPYLVWADLTDFAGFDARPQDPTGKDQIPVAVQLGRKYKPGDFAGVFSAPAIYQDEYFFTGLVPDDKLVEFRNRLQTGERFKLGLPAIPEVDRVVLQPMAQPRELAIGIIDHGFAFANMSFRERGTGATRVNFIWDQNRDRRRADMNPGNVWRKVAEFGYGGEIEQTAIDDLIRTHPDEALLYRKIAYEPAYGRLSHGTHIMDIACGDPNPLRNIDGFPNADPADASRIFDGPAYAAPIIAVQLPYRPQKDTSGASLCVHVLDALHYIRRRARFAGRIVVNLSDGAFAGPHSGTSLLESAIDEFLTKYPKMTLVVAAGNNYEAHSHARQTVSANSSGAPLKWRVLPDDFTDSFLEIWLDQPVGPAVSISVRPPGASVAKVVRMGETWIGDGGGVPICCVVATNDSPNGPGRGSFLLALAPTRPRTGARAAAPHGVWEIAVINGTGATIQVNAWIERDNPALGDKGPQRQSRFVEDSACVLGAGTLNSVATGAQTIVVGGFYARGRYFQETDPARRYTEVSRYSSAGPGRPGATYDGPDVSAPADESPVFLGLRAAANRSGTTVRLTGTSVAAPIVTRRIANMIRSANPPPLGSAAVKARLQMDHANSRTTVEADREGAGRVKPGKEPQ